MGKGGPEQRVRTSFLGDCRDPGDPGDCRACSKKLVFDDPSMLFSTFGPQEWPEGALEALGLIFLEKLPPEAAPHAHTLLLLKRESFFWKNCRRRQRRMLIPCFYEKGRISVDGF